MPDKEDNKKTGWVSIYRSLLNSSFVNNPKYLSLWIILLLKANREDHTFLHGNQKVTVKRGQILTGRKQLSEFSGIPEGTIETILNYFEQEAQIQQQKNSRYRLITIVNYDRYQENQQQNDNKMTQTINNNKYNKEKDEENDINKLIILKLWNSCFNKQYKTTKSFERNLTYWLGIYTLEEIVKAMVNARYNDYWANRITPEIFFRTKNPQREDIDRIGDFLNQKVVDIGNVDKLRNVATMIQQQKDALEAS